MGGKRNDGFLGDEMGKQTFASPTLIDGVAQNASVKPWDLRTPIAPLQALYSCQAKFIGVDYRCFGGLAQCCLVLTERQYLQLRWLFWSEQHE
jgi:hypothetical protein